ncbi:MAG: hypothetical protein LBK25_06670 [Treponema sp.]|nr:hypothetical protein [Treponema sp.]
MFDNFSTGVVRQASLLDDFATGVVRQEAPLTPTGRLRLLASGTYAVLGRVRRRKAGAISIRRGALFPHARRV